MNQSFAADTRRGMVDFTRKLGHKRRTRWWL